MEWFNNLKIKAKLIICFAILAVLTAFVGIMGISSMDKINKNATNMYNSNFIPANQLAKVQANMLYIRSNFLLIVYEKNAFKLQQRIDEITGWTEENSKLLTQYERTIQSAEEKNMYNELKSTDIPAYRAIREDVIRLLRAGKMAEAAAKIPEFAAAREKVERGFADLIELNKRYAEQASRDNQKTFKSQTIMMITAAVIGIALAILLGLIIASIISRSLNQLVGAANKIADGDLDISIKIDTKDEVGTLAAAFRKMTDNLNEVMTNISTASEQVASGARQVSDSSMALSQGATEQASSVEELTASLEEIAAQTQHNADSANEANSLAEAAKGNAVQGNRQMEEMLNAMEEINDSSSNISKIIKVIDEIAFQTNILALNAAVEAARAGQHGKGFAVVAEEVRSLAARSANAAKETTEMIESSIKKVEGGTRIANDTAEALNKIVDDITRVSSLVGNIAVASNEQALGISQVNQGLMQVSEVVQTNSATSEEGAAASEELSSQAELLQEQVTKFRLRKFQNSVRPYKGMEGINPDVLRMLEQMNEKKNSSPNSDGEAATNSKRIALSDSEFGKY